MDEPLQVLADELSQELCNGLVVHQPSYASDRPRRLGSTRWQTVRDMAFTMNTTNVLEGSEIMQSTFSKDYTS